MKELDKKIIKILKQGYPLTKRPFSELADILKIKEDLLLEKVKGMVRNKTIRRTGVALSHRRVGITSNAMVVWNAGEAQVVKQGKAASRFAFVSHCYERAALPNWPYNLYTMIHAKSKTELQKNIIKVARATKIKNYKILRSIKELKKTTPNFI